MPIPDFPTLMLPLLRLAGDAKQHPVTKATGLLGREFKTTPEQEARPKTSEAVVRALEEATLDDWNTFDELAPLQRGRS